MNVSVERLATAQDADRALRRPRVDRRRTGDFDGAAEATISSALTLALIGLMDITI